MSSDQFFVLCGIGLGVFVLYLAADIIDRINAVRSLRRMATRKPRPEPTWSVDDSDYPPPPSH